LQKKKIALVELYYHSEVLRTYLGLVAEVADYEVIVLSKASVLADIDESLLHASNIQYFIKPDATRISDFITTHLTLLNSCSSVLFLTLDSEFRFFSKLKLTPKKFLVVHAAYSVLQPLQHLAWQWDWRFWARLCKKIILEQESRYVKKMIGNMDALIFGSSTVEDFILKNKLLSKEKTIFSLPFTYYETRNPKLETRNFKLETRNSKLETRNFKLETRNSKPETRNLKLETQNSKPEITITITGTVEQNRRDYEVVFQAFQKCTFKTPVRLILLGRAKGKEGQKVINKFKSLENTYFKLDYFTEMIPQETFDARCAETDFFILPFTAKINFSIYEEIGGKTAVSGGVGDVIRYGVPGFVPIYYDIEPELTEMITPFENADDLAQQLMTWIADKNYVEKKEKSSILLQHYSKKALQQQFNSFISCVAFPR
jgi:hypothetical protein